MTTGYKPKHGTQSRYKGARNGNWDPCRCRVCTAGHARAHGLRQLAHLAGRPPLYPAGPLIEHIQALTDTGMSRDLIARRARVSHSTISYLMRGLTEGCHREKALRILAVTTGAFDDEAERPVAGSERRVQALYSIGHSPAVIAAAAGLSTSTISHIANSQNQIVQSPTAAAIAAAYKVLITRRGTSAKACARARKMGWHGPLAWGSDIDDPAAEPDLGDNSPALPGPILLQPCGTTAAHRRHLRRGEPVDEACAAANRLSVAERKHAKRQAAA